MEPDKRTLLLYYDMCCQNLIYYPGIPRKEIIEVIYELFNIRKDELINILDEEGTPVVLSSYLPNKTKLYIQIKKTFTEKFIENQNLQIKAEPIRNVNRISWVCNTPSGNSHSITNNGKTVAQLTNQSSEWCKGSLKMDHGEYYFTILIEPLQCCVQANIMPDKSKVSFEDFESMDFWKLWGDEYSDPHINFPGPTVEAGFYINMDLKVCVLYDHKKQRELKRFDFSHEWKEVYPTVYFKHVVSITISSDALKGRPDWLI